MTDPDAGTIAREIVSRHFEGDDLPENMEIADALAADIADTFRAYAAIRVAAETERCAKIAEAKIVVDPATNHLLPLTHEKYADGREIADAIRAPRTDRKPTVEELDVAQFGRVLHERPK